MAAQGAKRIPDLEVDGVKPAFPQAYSALVLSAAGVSLFITFLVCKNFYPCTVQVQHALLLYLTETITLENIQLTGKAPKIPKTFNQATRKFSTRVTSFNNISMGEITHKLLLIILKLQVESYDKIVAGAMDIAKKTHKTIHTDEVIDLTTDGPPEEFTMIVDIPSDDDNETMDLEDVKIKDENEEIEILYKYKDGGTDVDQDQEQDTMEDEYGEIGEAKGLAASGAGTVDCIRHNMKRPQAVGDIQKGKK